MTSPKKGEVVCWRGKCDNDPNEYMWCARWQRMETPCYESNKLPLTKRVSALIRRVVRVR